MKRALALILALVMTMALVACGGDKPTTSTPATPDKSTTTPTEPSKPTEPAKPSEPEKPAEPAKPAEPKILKLALTASPASAWSPASNTAASMTLQKYINGTLYAQMPVDGKAARIPQLAAEEPIDVNGDGLTWNIKISPNAKWENGEQINADTFLYSFKMTLDPKLVMSNASSLAKDAITIVNATEYYGQGKEGAAPVAWEDVGFKKVDEMTIQVTLKSAANASLVMRHFGKINSAPIYQPLFEKCLAADGASTTYGTTKDKILSSGAYKISQWVDGASYVFEKNEHFAKAEAVQLDGLSLTVIEDAGTRLQMFEKGDLDSVGLDAAGRDQYGDDPRVSVETGRRVYSIEFNTANTNKPIIANEKFRLALFYATDRVNLGKLVAQEPALSLVSATSIARDDGTSFRALAAAAGYQPSNNGYDPEKAKQLFDEAMKEEGLTSLELTVLCNSTMTDRCEFLQENWQTVFGADKFKLNIDSQPSGNASEARKGWKKNPNSYEITFTQWNLSGGDNDPITCLKNYVTSSSGRYAPYEYAELNAWYEEAGQHLLDQEKRNELALKMDQYIIEHCVVLPLTYETSFSMISDRVIPPVDEYNISLGWGLQYGDIAQ